MCGMCPDTVEICYRCRDDGKYVIWSLDSREMCEHMEEEFGTKDPILLWHVRQEHDPDDNFGRFVYDCDDHCLTENWYDMQTLYRCVVKVFYNFER